VLRLNREPFDRQAGDDAGESFNLAREITSDLGRVAFDDRDRRKFAPQDRYERRLALQRDDALGRAAGAHETLRQAAGARAELENRAWPLQVDATRNRVCKTSAARIGRSDPQRFL